MLLLPNPKKLMLGYLLGAVITSVTVGLVVVFSLEGSSAANTAQHTVNPAVDIALGILALVIALILGKGYDHRLSERRRARKGPKKDTGPPRWQKALSTGSPRLTFLVGAALTLPGGSYLAALDQIAKQHLGTAATVAVVLGFNVIMLMMLELPLLGFAIAPDWTPVAVRRFTEWLNRNGRRMATRGAAAVGVLLIVRAVIFLVTG
jgi:Sap, sulfolipid-1-addressing protein